VADKFTEKRLNMRILVAEDEKDLNGLIEKKLTKSGYSVDTAFDGEETDSEESADETAAGSEEE